MKGPNESLTDYALRIFDTAEPPITPYRAAKLAGIRPETLYQRLREREQYEAERCPHCHRYPGQRNWKRKASRVPPSDQRTPPAAPKTPLRRA